MQEMMKKVMSGVMKPEDMPKMMESMMDNVFGQMSARDRISFTENMMPRCIALIFAQLEPPERQELARRMLERMMQELKTQSEKSLN